MFLAIAFFSLTALSITLRPAAAGTYTITNLNSLGNFVWAYTLNNSASAVGNSAFINDATFFGPRSATMRTSSTTTDIGRLPGYTYGRATSINASDFVVGYSWSGKFTEGNGTGSAFTYRNGTLSPLSALNTALDVNDAGDIVGQIGTSPAVYRNGTATKISTLVGAANAINSVGSIVGLAGSHPFLYESGTFTDLGLPTGRTFAEALDINDGGTIVGDTVGSSISRAFIYASGSYTILPSLGGNFAAANAINNAGTVVGYSYTSQAVEKAFIYQNGVMTDLNTVLPPGSGWVLEEATDINNNGDILGNGFLNGTRSAFLLTSVPEPALASLVLFLPLLRRRRSRLP